MRLAVYCGSSHGFDPIHADAARALGGELAAAGVGLVYGGGNVGLMGTIADAALAGGGEVIGVIPQALVDREVAHHGLTELHVTGSMHERKQMMADLSDGFIALPGGIGTMEELFEVWTWGQLGYHAKPCALLNVGGYYDGLIAFLDSMVASGFLNGEHRAMLIEVDSIGDLLDRLADHVPQAVDKWIGRRDL